MTTCPVCGKTQLVFVAGPLETWCYYCGAHWVQDGSEQQAVKSADPSTPSLEAVVAESTVNTRTSSNGSRPDLVRRIHMQTETQTRSVVTTLEQEHLHMTVVRLLTNEIAPSRKHQGFFDYPFELAALPQAAWALEFKAAYDAIKVERKGEVHLAGARIVATVLADDDKQQIADTIKQAVEEANARCKEVQDQANDDADRHRQTMAHDRALLRRLQEEAKGILV
jgi:DNA-binding protein YbaB